MELSLAGICVVFLLYAFWHLTSYLSTRELPKRPVDSLYMAIVGFIVAAAWAFLLVSKLVDPASIEAIPPGTPIPKHTDPASIWEILRGLLLFATTIGGAITCFVLWMVANLDLGPLVSRTKNLSTNKPLRGWHTSFKRADLHHSYSPNSYFSKLTRALGLEYFVKGAILLNFDGFVRGDAVHFALWIEAGPKATPVQFAAWVELCKKGGDLVLENCKQHAKDFEDELWRMATIHFRRLHVGYLRVEIQGPTIARPTPVQVKVEPFQVVQQMDAVSADHLPLWSD